MHQRKGKKIVIYFFLLILVGSINNINLNNLRLLYHYLVRRWQEKNDYKIGMTRSRVCEKSRNR